MGAPYVQEEQPLGEIMQDRVTDLFRMQLAARERRQVIFRTLQATARHQAELGKAAPITPPKAAPQVLVDRLQAEREEAAPTTPPKAAPKALGPSGSSTVEAPTPVVEAEEAEELLEELEFASQFAPPCGAERQYLDVEPGQPTPPMTGRGEESEDSRSLKAAKSAARRLLEDLVEEQERLDTLDSPAEPPTEAPTASHMPFSALEGARLGFLDPEQVQEFIRRHRCPLLRRHRRLLQQRHRRLRL